MRRLLAFSFALTALGIAPVIAQDAYPSRPIRVVIPFPPGGVVDILARMFTPKFGEGLKQNIVIDNRGGANGNIAVEMVAKSQPDGYTLLFGQVSNLAVNPAIYPNVPFDPVKDLAPVGLVAATPQLLVVGASSKLQSVADMIAAAKAKPGELTYASSGQGSLGHMGFELMQLSAGLKLVHIPYKGAGPALIDVMGGRAELFVAAMPALIGHIRGGKLRALAIMTAARRADLPNIPTLSEAGFPGYESSNWFAIMARAGTPPAIIQRLNAEINRTIEAPEVKAKYEHEGAAMLGGTPEQLAKQLATDLDKWKRVVKEAGIKVE